MHGGFSGWLFEFVTRGMVYRIRELGMLRSSMRSPVDVPALEVLKAQYG